MTIPVVIKGLVAGLPETYTQLCSKEPIAITRIEDDGSLCDYVYLEIEADSVMRFTDQNEYNQWKIKNGQIEEISL